VTPSDPAVSLPGTPLRELEQRWKLSRNGLKARARALGVELERVSSTLTLWPGDFVELGDRLNDHLKAGQPMGTFPGLAPAGSAGSAIKKASAAPAPDALAVAIAQAVAATAVSLPGSASVDPLRRARALAEAADNALVLTSDELSALGVRGVDRFADGDEAYGYRFHKHQQRGRTLWTLARTIGKAAGTASATALTASRPVGFAGAIEARCQTLFSSVELPFF
jgi:hypothetical protein